MTLSKWQQYEVLIEAPPYMPIGRVSEFRKRALYLLKGKDAGEVRDLSIDIEVMIEEFFASELEAWVQRKIEVGGSVWGYLPDDCQDEQHLRQLARDRPSFVSRQEFDFPHEENTSVVEAIEWSLVDQDQRSGAAKPHEYLAVLALRDLETMVRGYCSSEFQAPNGDDKAIKIRIAANAMMEIVEAVCRAESLMNEAEHGVPYHLKLAESIKAKHLEEDRARRSSMAKRAAEVSHAEHTASRQEALLRWQKEQHLYSSAAAFGRAVFKDYGVQARQIEKWITAYRKAKG